MNMVLVAQQEERLRVKQKVTGSCPVMHPKHLRFVIHDL